MVDEPMDNKNEPQILTYVLKSAHPNCVILQIILFIFMLHNFWTHNVFLIIGFFVEIIFLPHIFKPIEKPTNFLSFFVIKKYYWTINTSPAFLFSSIVVGLFLLFLLLNALWLRDEGASWFFGGLYLFYNIVYAILIIRHKE